MVIEYLQKYVARDESSFEKLCPPLQMIAKQGKDGKLTIRLEGRTSNKGFPRVCTSHPVISPDRTQCKAAFCCLVSCSIFEKKSPQRKRRCVATRVKNLALTRRLSNADHEDENLTPFIAPVT